MNRTPLSPRRILTALVIACTVAGLAPAVASADPAPVPLAQQGHKKHKAKLDAGVEKAKVKVGEETKIKGSFADVGGLESLSGGEPIVVQKLVGSTWVDLTTGTCKPNGHFKFSLSFTLRASLTLRVFHPETDLYVSVSSSLIALLVI